MKTPNLCFATTDPEYAECYAPLPLSIFSSYPFLDDPSPDGRLISFQGGFLVFQSASGESDTEPMLCHQGPGGGFCTRAYNPTEKHTPLLYVCLNGECASPYWVGSEVAQPDGNNTFPPFAYMMLEIAVSVLLAVLWVGLLRRISRKLHGM